MANWWKTDSGSFINVEHAAGMYVFQKSGSWVIRVHLPVVSLTSGAPAEADLAGTYSTQAEAEDAMARLVNGFDPSL